MLTLQTKYEQSTYDLPVCLEKARAKRFLDTRISRYRTRLDHNDRKNKHAQIIKIET